MEEFINGSDAFSPIFSKLDRQNHLQKIIDFRGDHLDFEDLTAEKVGKILNGKPGASKHPDYDMKLAKAFNEGFNNVHYQGSLRSTGLVALIRRYLFKGAQTKTKDVGSKSSNEGTRIVQDQKFNPRYMNSIRKEINDTREKFGGSLPKPVKEAFKKKFAEKRMETYANLVTQEKTNGLPKHSPYLEQYKLKTNVVRRNGKTVRKNVSFFLVESANSPDSFDVDDPRDFETQAIPSVFRKLLTKKPEKEGGTWSKYTKIYDPLSGQELDYDGVLAAYGVKVPVKPVFSILKPTDLPFATEEIKAGWQTFYEKNYMSRFSPKRLEDAKAAASLEKAYDSFFGSPEYGSAKQITAVFTMYVAFKTLYPNREPGNISVLAEKYRNSKQFRKVLQKVQNPPIPEVGDDDKWSETILITKKDGSEKYFFGDNLSSSNIVKNKAGNYSVKGLEVLSSDEVLTRTTRAIGVKRVYNHAAELSFPINPSEIDYPILFNSNGQMKSVKEGPQGNRHQHMLAYAMKNPTTIIPPFSAIRYSEDFPSQSSDLPVEMIFSFRQLKVFQSILKDKKFIDYFFSNKGKDSPDKFQGVEMAAYQRFMVKYPTISENAGFSVQGNNVFIDTQ